MKLNGRAVRTFTRLPGGLMRIKTYSKGGRLISEWVVPAAEGRQIQQGYRPKARRLGPDLGKVD